MLHNGEASRQAPGAQFEYGNGVLVMVDVDANAGSTERYIPSVAKIKILACVR